MASDGNKTKNENPLDALVKAMADALAKNASASQKPAREPTSDELCERLAAENGRNGFRRRLVKRRRDLGMDTSDGSGAGSMGSANALLPKRRR